MRATSGQSSTLAQTLSTVRPLVTASPAWAELATQQGFATSCQLVLVQTIARRPGLTLGGYADHLHVYASSVIASLLERLPHLFVLERGRYWPTQTYAASAVDRMTAGQTALAAWQGLPPTQLHELAELTEQLCAAIPIEQLRRYSLYAYGPRPARDPERSVAERILVACTALSNYRADAQALAWAGCDLPPAWGMLVQLLAHAPEPQLAEAVCGRARQFLGTTTASVLQTLVAAEWIVVEGRFMRLTATGWAHWAQCVQALNDQLDPIYAAISMADQERCIRSVAQLRRHVAAYQRSYRQVVRACDQP
jgi:hypothetical protein